MIKNAIIESVRVGFDRGFVLTCWLTLDYGGSGQGFGGFVLGGNVFSECACNDHKNQVNICAEFLSNVLGICGVEDMKDCVGKTIRVETDSEKDFGGNIVAIGHIVKDRWYNPTQSMKDMGVKK